MTTGTDETRSLWRRLRAWLRAGLCSLGRWLGVAEGDTIVVRDGHQVLAQPGIPTGTQTDGRRIYVGDDDPAILHAADLLPGDLWVDTTVLAGTGLLPATLTKVRNITNDDWDFAVIGASDGAGNLVARITTAADGSIRIDSRIGLDPSGAVLLNADGSVWFTSGVAWWQINPDGSFSIEGDNTHLTMAADGTLSYVGGAASISAAPDGTIGIFAGAATATLNGDGSIDFDGTTIAITGTSLTWNGTQVAVEP